MKKSTVALASCAPAWEATKPVSKRGASALASTTSRRDSSALSSFSAAGASKWILSGACGWTCQPGAIGLMTTTSLPGSPTFTAEVEAPVSTV